MKSGTKKLTALIVTLMVCALGLPALAAQPVQADQTVDTKKQNYMTDDQYAALGFSGLKDPTAFSSTDTSDPLSGYSASVLSELLVGQVNRDDDKGHNNYEGFFQIMQGPATADSSAMNLNNMAKSLVGGIQNYFDKRNDDGMYTQCKNTIALRPGKISETDVSTKDIIIEDTLYCQEGGAFQQDDSMQRIMAWSLDGSDAYHSGNWYTKKLDDGNWVGDIKVKEADGFTAMAVGDFDGDDYYEVAVFTPENGGGRIIFFQPVQNGDSYNLQEESYSVNIASLSDYYNMDDGIKRPTVQLNTTSMAGRDDLAISVSLPYTGQDNCCNNSCLAIYSFQNGSTSQCFNNNLVVNNDAYRFKFNATCNADLNGDGVDELVVAGNKNDSYKNGDTQGKISTDENLVNVVLWDGSNYGFAWKEPQSLHANALVYSEDEVNAPATVTAGHYFAEDKKDVVFCEGVYYHFATGSGTQVADTIRNGSFTCNSDEDFTFDQTLEDMVKNNGLDYARAYKPYIAKAVTASFVEDSRTVEQTVVISGSDSRNGVSHGDWTDMDVFWLHGYGGKIVEEKTNSLYVDSQDEDDNGTLLTLCALNVDDDTVYTQYTGKEVGWSNPAVQSVMLSTPYWNELSYGDQQASRGLTSYTTSVSAGTSTGSSGNIGLNLGYTLGMGASALGTGGSLGFSFDSSAGYVHSFQSSNLHTDSLTFSGGGGLDRVGLTVTPVAIYKYNVWVPEHKAVQSEVDDQVAVGDTVPAAMREMAVSVQLAPASTSIPVDTYNRFVTDYNAKKSADEVALPTVDVDKLYPGRVAGDPTTYQNDIPGATRAQNDASITISQGSTTNLTMTDTYSESTSNGYNVNVKATLTETIKAGLSFFGFSIGSENKFSQGVSGGWSQTWTGNNSSSMTYSGTFASLPASAQTGTSSTSDKVSAYDFTTALEMWKTDLSNGQSVSMDDGTTVQGQTPVIGYAVSNAGGAPKALPTDLHVLTTTDTTAVLAWTPPIGARAPGSYKVYYSKTSGDGYQPVQRDGSDLIVNGAASGCIVTGLLSNTDYYFRLEAYGGPDATGIKSVQGHYAQGRTTGDAAYQPVIDTQPVDVYTQVGSKADFSIKAHAQIEGDSLTYQWQKLELDTNKTAVWNNVLGATSADFNAAYFNPNGQVTDTNKTDLDGTVYRCVVTEHKASGNDSKSLSSRSATLYIGAGNATVLNLTVPADQAAVLDTDDNGQVTLLADKSVNVSGVLTTKDIPITGESLETTAASGIANHNLLVHLIDLNTLTISDTQQVTTDSDGSYTVTYSNGLKPGSYDLVSVYKTTTGDYKTTLSPIMSLTVLDGSVTHTITYELNGGTNATDNPATFTASSGTIVLKDAAKIGADFTGWYIDTALTDKITEIDASKNTNNMTLYAGWQNISYTITYNLDGGTNAPSNPSSFTIADSVLLEAPAKDGFNFDGWYADAAFTKKVTGIAGGSTGDQTFYAKWTTPTPPPVQPDGNGSYPIGTYAELQAVAQAIQNDPDTYAGASYYLTANIKGGDAVWTVPIGTAAHPFSGSFDGRDYYVLGLTIAGGEANEEGLFGVIGTRGKVENLSVIDMNWQAQSGVAGGLAAVNEGTISGCGSGFNGPNSGTYPKNGEQVPISELNSDVRGHTAGGLVGINRGTITDSRSNADVSGSTAGGIAGQNEGTITNVYNTGSVTGDVLAGGIAGSSSGPMAYGYTNKAAAGSGTIGAIAGSASLMPGKFYYPDTAAAAVGQDAVQTTATSDWVPMSLDAMRTQTFCDMLNADIAGQNLRGWTYKASDNAGYPRILKSTVVSQTLTDPATGIRISGSIHPDARLVIRRVDPQDSDYQAILSSGRLRGNLRAYSVGLVYADGTQASYEGSLTLSFPVSWLSHLDRQTIAQFLDGRLSVYDAAVEGGRLKLTVGDLGTFAYNDGTAGASESSDNVNTGYVSRNTAAFLALLFAAGAGSVLMLHGFERKRRYDRKK